jgi:hypothetical protein
MNAEWTLLGLRGHIPMPKIQGARDPEYEKHLRRLLARPGRPSTAIAHAEWAERFRELYAELCAGYELYHVNGDRPPSKIEVAQDIAIEDFAEHPERWDYDPRNEPVKAARRVWGAVKPLV